MQGRPGLPESSRSSYEILSGFSSRREPSVLPPPPERLPSHNLRLAGLPRAYKGSEISGLGGEVSDKKSMEEEIKQLIKSGLVNGGKKKTGDKLKREQTWGSQPDGQRKCFFIFL